MADKKDKAGSKSAKNLRISKKDFYILSKEGRLERKKRHCPKCGPGVFLAEHQNRNSCGKCGYTEFKKK
ncbi:MAG: 30S ribosomal protein S27ae [Methanomassiliicoccales archaeon]